LVRKKRNNNKKPVNRGKKIDFLNSIKSFFFICLISLLFILGHDIITQAKYFTTKQINIFGLKLLSREQVLNQANLSDEINILSVSVSGIEKKLLQNPWIRSAQVKRNLPDRLMIEIQERTPIAIIKIGQKFLVDEKGFVFKEWEEQDPVDLPLVVGLDAYDVVLGSANNSKYFNAVIDILTQDIASENFITNYLIRQISVDKEIGLSLFSYEHSLKIQLGFNKFHEKYLQFNRLLSYLQAQEIDTDIRFVDLKDINRIVIRPNYEMEPTARRIEKDARSGRTYSRS